MGSYKQTLLISSFVLIATFLLLSTCKRDDRDNPWDAVANLDPDTWAPKSLVLEDISITEKKLIWTYEGDERIEGFQIDRKVGNADWEIGFHVAEKDERVWIDESITPDTTISYTYRLFTFAGENSSSYITNSSFASFPSPSNIEIEKLSDKSYQITWNDNSTGEEGFKIDRRTDGGEWIISYGAVDASQTAFVDTNVFVSKSTMPVVYRVYAFFGSHESAKLTIDTNASLTAPTNLSITVNSQTSITLNWEYNASSHEGFKIDKKNDTEPWQLAIATVNATQKTFTDNSVNFLIHDGYTYRVYAYHNLHNSQKIENYIFKPTVVTSSITNIMATSATSGGEVTDSGGATVTTRGVVWSTMQEPTLNNNQGNMSQGNGTGNFTCNLTNLNSETEYYIRAYAINSAGTKYGEELSFTTQTGVIDITTTEVSEITVTTAVSGGSITSDGGAPITIRGVVWSTLQNPTTSTNEGITSNGSGTGTYASNLTNLAPITTYYVRAYATNVVSTSYGNQEIFTTSYDDDEFGSITDIEGNTYQTKYIGGKEWMVENLKVTKYNNGQDIINATYNSEWSSLEVGSFVWYNNDIGYKQLYGALYNWYAVDAGNLCPIGWHVPSDEEWSQLTNFLINNSIEISSENVGNILKSCRQVNSPLGGNCNTNEHPRWDYHVSHYGTDNFNFASLPGGLRRDYGLFEAIGKYGTWWTSTQSSQSEAVCRFMFYSFGNVQDYYSTDKKNGFSVRCIKD